MRHGKKFNHLGRKAGHRKALLRNMSIALIEHKRISTTLAKAKALRKFIEPLITKSKTNSIHSRRVAFSYLQNKYAAKELFEVVGPKVMDRPGGYVRILKTGFRKGDGAEMAIIELVDFNETMLALKADGKSSGKKRTRRGRRKKTEDAPAAISAAETTAEVIEDSVAETENTAEADDLTKIEGIGPKISEVLQAGGISTFAQLAGSNADAIKAILEAAEGNFAAHDPGTWAQQAQMAADGKWDELKKWQDELDGGKEVNKDDEA